MGTLVVAPEPWRREWGRWAIAAAIMVMGHIGVIVALTGWPSPAAPPGATLPPILLDLAPVSTAPELLQDDLAPGPQIQQADAPATPIAPPPPVEPSIAPTPPQPDPAVALPPEPKPRPVTPPVPEPVRPKPAQQQVRHPAERPPAPKTTAPPRAERPAPEQHAAAAGASAAAAVASYEAELAAHLQRFKQYPAAARAAHEQGTAVLSFTVSRSGQVVGSHIGHSSGFAALDAETMALLRRAQPLPAFPPEMRQASKSFNVPISYAIR